MENAVDALHMAAGVLIFVLALTISINAFTQVRITSRTLIEANDREYDYIDAYVEESGTTERIINLESIVPSIYKAYKENYKIVFKDNANDADGEARTLLGTDGIYSRKDEAGRDVGVYSIDLQNETLGSEEQKEQFIMAILYGNRYSDFDTVRDNFIVNLGIYLNETGIYDKIRSRGTGLKESLGIYYQEETPQEGVDSSEDDDLSSVPDSNKTIKRVITYSIQ